MKNHNQYIGGIADCWYSGLAGDLWIEYKFITLPKRESTVIDLVSGKNPDISYLQQDWLKSRHAEGRSVGVIVGCTQGGVWFPGLKWDQTHTPLEFKKMMLDRRSLAGMISELC